MSGLVAQFGLSTELTYGYTYLVRLLRLLEATACECVNGITR